MKQQATQYLALDVHPGNDRGHGARRQRGDSHASDAVPMEAKAVVALVKGPASVRLLRLMRVSQRVAVGLAVIVASGITLAGLALLIRSPIQNDLLAIVLGAVILLGPALVVVWAFTRRSASSASSSFDEPSQPLSPWLEIWDEEEQGFTVIGDSRGLDVLGAECLRVAHNETSDDPATIEISDIKVNVVRKDARPVPEPQTWRDKLFAAGCLVLLGLVGAIWLRGCVAVERDLERWFN